MSAPAGAEAEGARAGGPHDEEGHRSREAERDTAARTLRSARLRRHWLTLRLCSVQASCRRRAKLIPALAVAHRDALSQYRDLVEVVTRILRERGPAEPDETMEVTAGMLAAITRRTCQLEADYAREQAQLAGMRRFEEELGARVLKETERVWQTRRRLTAVKAPTGPLRDSDST